MLFLNFMCEDKEKTNGLEILEEIRKELKELKKEEKINRKLLRYIYSDLSESMSSGTFSLAISIFLGIIALGLGCFSIFLSVYGGEIPSDLKERLGAGMLQGTLILFLLAFVMFAIILFADGIYSWWKSKKRKEELERFKRKLTEEFGEEVLEQYN